MAPLRQNFVTSRSQQFPHIPHPIRNRLNRPLPNAKTDRCAFSGMRQGHIHSGFHPVAVNVRVRPSVTPTRGFHPNNLSAAAESIGDSGLSARIL